MSTIEELLITKPINDAYLRAYLNVMYTGVWLHQKVSQMLKPYDITEPQYNVLRILKGQKGNSMNLYEIQNRMIQKMSNVSRLIDKLLSKGLVERKECKDNRRRVDITITEQGITMLNTIRPSMDELLVELNANLKEEEAVEISTLLDNLRND